MSNTFKQAPSWCVFIHYFNEANDLSIPFYVGISKYKNTCGKPAKLKEWHTKVNAAKERGVSFKVSVIETFDSNYDEAVQFRNKLCRRFTEEGYNLINYGFYEDLEPTHDILFKILDQSIKNDKIIKFPKSK